MEKRTKDNPWKLKTPPQTSDYEMYVDTKDGKEIIVCTVAPPCFITTIAVSPTCMRCSKSTAIGWSWAARMKNRKPWPAPLNIGAFAENSHRRLVWIEEGIRGRFAMYIPPLMEDLGLAEVEHNPRNNRMTSEIVPSNQWSVTSSPSSSVAPA